MTINSMNSASSNLSLNTFISSFFKEGRVFNQKELEVTLTLKEIYDLVSRYTVDNVVRNGVYRVASGGAIDITDVVDFGDHRVLKYKSILNPRGDRDFLQDLEVCSYTPPRKAGVFNISIDHWYIDKTNSPAGELKCIEHSRDTEDFEKLMFEMYPGIDIKEMMKQYSISDESLMILSGQPGTGKTCFAKLMMAAHALTHECDIDAVYVKDRELLRKDQFWAIMGRTQPDMIILDDLDSELLPRTQENPNEIVSNLLSYSDGIFDVDTKILITTNLTDSLIDKALVRPGRSFDTLCLPQLSREEALSIWEGSFDSPADEFKLRFGEMPVISQAALMSEYQRYMKSSAPTYLLDPSISIRKLVEEGEVIGNA